jgi:four helix bundle protein
MDRDKLQSRTKPFSLRVLRAVSALPKTPAGFAVVHQLVRCGTSVGANYRAARRARSRREFTAKLGVVVEEADEAQYWLELVRDAGFIPPAKIEPLIDEATELVRILSTSRRTCLSRPTVSEIHQIATLPDRQLAK